MRFIPACMAIVGDIDILGELQFANALVTPMDSCTATASINKDQTPAPLPLIPGYWTRGVVALLLLNLTLACKSTGQAKETASGAAKLLADLHTRFAPSQPKKMSKEKGKEVQRK